MFHCLQVPRSSVEDDGKDREDAAAKSKAEPRQIKTNQRVQP